MPEAQSPTRKRIVDAATRLFYAEGIGRVSVDAVAEEAGLTKRTLYYHFKSKDDLIAAYLDGRDQPNLKRMAGWFDAAEGGADRKVEAIFTNLARAARHPKWKGCGFLRTAAELASMPGIRRSRSGRDTSQISKPGWLAHCPTMASRSRKPWRARSCC